MRKSERTKQFIIRIAAPVFNKKGYAGTSLSDLTDATGLTKGSIYGNFDNKESLAVHVFAYGVGRIREHVQSHLTGAQTVMEKIYRFLDFFLAYVFNPPVPGGCVLLNTAVEADDNYPALKEQVALELTHSVDYLKQLLEEAVATGAVSNTCHPDNMAHAIFCSIEGAVMMSRVYDNTEPMQAVISYWKNQLQQFQTQ